MKRRTLNKIGLPQVNTEKKKVGGICKILTLKFGVQTSNCN